MFLLHFSAQASRYPVGDDLLGPLNHMSQNILDRLYIMGNPTLPLLHRYQVAGSSGANILCIDACSLLDEKGCVRKKRYSLSI